MFSPYKAGVNLLPPLFANRSNVLSLLIPKLQTDNIEWVWRWYRYSGRRKCVPQIWKYKKQKVFYKMSEPTSWHLRTEYDPVNNSPTFLPTNLWTFIELLLFRLSFQMCFVIFAPFLFHLKSLQSIVESVFKSKNLLSLYH